MNRIALISGEHFLYWHALILALSVICAVFMYRALALRNPEDRTAAWAAVPLAFMLSLVLSRLVHWYCRPQGYQGAWKALTDYSRGSFALIGVFAGCLLTALILRGLRVSLSLPRMLDQMSVAGALGIAVGRLAALFTTQDRGMPVPDFLPFPIASKIENGVSGETEVRLAVFMIQALIAGILFFTLLCSYLNGKKKRMVREGDTCLKFLLFYCGSQAVLDSPRYDSLYFRSNGFVSIVQIFSVLTIVTILVIFTVRMCRAGNARKLWLLLLILPLLGLAGYMEYHVQRHGGEALFAYSVMSGSMLFAVLLMMRLYKHGLRYPEAEVTPEPFMPEEDDWAHSTFEEDEIRERPVQVPSQRRSHSSSRRYQGKFSAPRNQQGR